MSFGARPDLAMYCASRHASSTERGTSAATGAPALISGRISACFGASVLVSSGGIVSFLIHLSLHVVRGDQPLRRTIARPLAGLDAACDPVEQVAHLAAGEHDLVGLPAVDADHEGRLLLLHHVPHARTQLAGDLGHV